MNFTVMDSPDLALAALKKKEGLSPVSLSQEGTDLCILCAEEAAFRMDLVLQDARGEAKTNEIWNNVFLEETCLRYESQAGKTQIRFSRAQGRLWLKNYARNLPAFAPYHYVRDSFGHLLGALKAKSETLSSYLTKEEKRFLPLCDLTLFETAKKAPATCALLLELGILRLPLEENEEALAALERLQTRLTTEEQVPQNLLEAAGTPESFELRFGVKNLRVSLGLKTHSLIRKNLRCLVNILPCDENLLLLCGTTDRKEISRPTECAVAGKGFRCFEVYAVKREEFSQERLREITEHACLKGSKGEPFARTQRPKLFAPAVFAVSGLLWGGICFTLAHALSLAFPPIPDASGLLALCIGVYTLLRFYFYSSSVKR